MELIDSHAHLTSQEMYQDIEGVIQRAKENHIRNVINICTDQESLEKGIELAERIPWIFNSGATTPHDVEKLGEKDFPVFAKMARTKKLKAVGETGLDYYYEHSNKETQKKFLIKYFHLALETDLPLVIHCREAFEDLFSFANSEYKSSKAVLHCFTGTMKEAEKVLERNWFLSLSGIVTFKKSEGLREVAKEVPLDQLLIETDSPYLAPQKYRGKKNEPSYLIETLKEIAAVKNMEVSELALITTQNAKRFFSLD